jgi:hypothetical protein
MNPPDDRPKTGKQATNEAPEILAFSSPASGKVVTRREFIQAGLVVSVSTILAGTWSDLSFAQNKNRACSGDRCTDASANCMSDRCYSDYSGACSGDMARQGKSGTGGASTQTTCRADMRGSKPAVCPMDRSNAGQVGGQRNAACPADRCGIDSSRPCTQDICRNDRTTNRCVSDSCRNDRSGSCYDRCQMDSSSHCTQDSCRNDATGSGRFTQDSCRNDRTKNRCVSNSCRNDRSGSCYDRCQMDSSSHCAQDSCRNDATGYCGSDS